MNRINLNEILCCGCGACYNICKFNAIEMIEDEKGFCIPIINKEKCVDCGVCKNICPVLNNKNSYSNCEYPIAYAMYNKNEKIREASSSGGIFSLVAETIISKSGTVYGAAFNEDNLVEHIRIDLVDDLYKLQGSKYVQSRIGEVYQLVKLDLENRKEVLFTGTPCQIEGLKAYLGCEYNNLYLQDIICHRSPITFSMEKIY